VKQIRGVKKLDKRWSKDGQKLDKGATSSQLKIADWKIED
jgi:hypothetical protein